MKKESLKFSIYNLILEDGVPGQELFSAGEIEDAEKVG